MSEFFRTMIVTAADAPLARTIAAALDPVHSQGMWETALSPSGAEPATHYISSGYVSAGFAAPLPFAVWALGEDGKWVQTSYEAGDPAAVAARCAQAEPPVEVTEEQIAAMFAASDVTDEDGWTALGRLGLVLVRPPEPAAEEAPASLE